MGFLVLSKSKYEMWIRIDCYIYNFVRSQRHFVAAFFNIVIEAKVIATDYCHWFAFIQLFVLFDERTELGVLFVQ